MAVKRLCLCVKLAVASYEKDAFGVPHDIPPLAHLAVLTHFSHASLYPRETLYVHQHTCIHDENDGALMIGRRTYFKGVNDVNNVKRS